MKDFLTSHDWLGRSGPFNASIEYIIYILLFVLLGVGLIVFLKWKNSPKAVKITLIVLWAINLGLDMLKLVALRLRGPFNIGSDMLLYICSLFLYAMPFAIWGKGKLKDIGCTFVCTIGFFGAIMNFVVPSTVIDHSLFSYLGFHTVTYHLNLLLVPFIMLITGYYKVVWKDFGWAFLGFVVLTIPALFFNFMAGTDWMYLGYGADLPFPFIPALVDAIGSWWTLIAYAGYAAIQALFMLLIWAIDKLVRCVGKFINKNKPALAMVEGDNKAVEQESTLVEKEETKEPAKVEKPTEKKVATKKSASKTTTKKTAK